MSQYILSFFMLVTVGACSFAPPKLELPDRLEVASDIEPYLMEATQKGFPPSISIAVLSDGIIEYENYFGHTDALKSVDVTKDTVYQWWSITKLFTAVAVLQLQEKGLLDLDDPVDKHLPFFKVENLSNGAAPITVRQLLSHSSGLGDVGMSILGWIHFEGDPKIDQTEFLKKKFPLYRKLATQPGKEGRYSNFGYLVLAGVIEAVSGSSYESYITDNILSPLGMRNTAFTYTDSMREFEAIGSHPKDALSFIVPFYIDTNRTYKEQVNGRIWFNRVYSDQQGATGLIGSTADMSKFMQVLLNGGLLNGKRILSQESVAEMQNPIISVDKSPAPNSNGLEFGLGWFIDQSESGKVLTHSGAGMGFVTTLRLYPESNSGVVVFANSTYLGRTMGNEIVDLVGATVNK